MGFGNISNETNTFSFSSGNIYTIFDTGSPQIIVPWKFYDAILANIMKTAGGQVFYNKDGITYVDCYEVGSFGSLFFLVNQRWLEIQPWEYIWDVNNDGSVCILMLVQQR